jgi:L-threonylcarbamoyladenylate synthase
VKTSRCRFVVIGTASSLFLSAFVVKLLFAFSGALRETSSVNTVLTTSAEVAAEYLKRGGVVAFPTETVYGLGANVFDERAVTKIFEAKRRPADNPLIAHISRIEQITELATEVTEAAQRLIDAFFPGPLTVVLQKRPEVPLIATAGLDTIGVRMPSFDLAHRFLSTSGTPVVAPSANLSGKPSPTTWQAVFEDLDGRIDCILQGEPTEIGLESTVVDCTGPRAIVLRPGSVSIEEIRAVIPSAVQATAASDAPRSPGLRHQHYSPSASVSTDGPQPGPDRAFIGLHDPGGTFGMQRVCSNIDEYASALYEFFRECDRQDIAVIYCEPVREEGIGIALMDRIKRAAAG